VLAILAAIGMVDRARGARGPAEGDPRLPLFVAALLLAWASLAAVPIPGIATPLPSLFTLAGRFIPAFDALRGGAVIVEGNVLVGALLAGFGVAALLRGRMPAMRAVVVAVALGAALAEVFVPALARRSYGRSVQLTARVVRPPEQLVALYGAPAEGGVLDLPYGFTRGRFGLMSDYILLASFHHRPAAACYNSFHVALSDEIAERAERVLQDAHAADALLALGIRDVVLHQAAAGGRAPSPPAIPPPHLREVGRLFGRVRYALVGSAAVDRSFAPLAAGAAADPAVDASPVTAKAGASTVDVRIANGSTATYRQPDPLEPPLVLARWQSDAGVVEQRVRQYLPAALVAGEVKVQRCAIAVPVRPGRYRLTLAPADRPDLVIAAQMVEVTA
jgi:hypothetical protein